MAAVHAAVLEETFRSMKRTLDTGAPATPNARIDQTVRYLVGHPELVRLSLFRILGGVPNPREDLWVDYLARMRGLVTGPGGQPGVDVQMLAVILLGATLLWSLRVHSRTERASDTDRYLRELKRLLLFGVIRPDAHPEIVRAVRPAAVPEGARQCRRARNSRSSTGGAAR